MSTSCLQVVYKQIPTILYANRIVPDGASVRSFSSFTGRSHMQAIQWCLDNDRKRVNEHMPLVVSAPLTCNTKANSLSNLASKRLVARNLRSWFIKYASICFVRQSLYLCRQEKLSTSCLQVVYNLSTSCLHGWWRVLICATRVGNVALTL